MFIAATILREKVTGLQSFTTSVRRFTTSFHTKTGKKCCKKIKLSMDQDSEHEKAGRGFLQFTSPNVPFDKHTHCASYFLL